MALPPKRTEQAGFTLVELLTVLVILVAVAAFAMPSIGKRGAADLNSTARLLAAGLRGARAAAIATSKSVSLTVDLEQFRMQLADAANAPMREAKPLSSSLRYKLFTAKTEQIGERGARIRFYPDGSSTGGRVTVSTDKSALLVDVDWLTGAVRVLEGGPEDIVPASLAASG